MQLIVILGGYSFAIRSRHFRYATNHPSLVFPMKKRLFLTLLLAAAVCLPAWRPSTAAENELGIGSKAPAIDIEHWIQDGNGFFKPVTEFEPGKVYVVEFWATWCGPCIMSMPHLAELQNQYRGRDVQIISVSDESVDEVKDLLAREHPQAEKTFAEITSAYSLTTDPDRSVYTDYMDAAKQDGIPTAFIVGKSGLVEWIGHPGNMDQPLEQIVNDSWDREAFKAEMKIQQELQENMQEMSKLMASGKLDEAFELVNAQINDASSEMLRDHWTAIRYSLKLSSGELDDDTLAFYRNQMKQMQGDVESLLRFSYSLYGIYQQGAEIGPLAGEAVAALEAEKDAVSDQMKPVYYNTLAALHNASGEAQKAIEAQQAAIDASSDPRQKKRLLPMLEELKSKAEPGDEDEKQEQDEKTDEQ